MDILSKIKRIIVLFCCTLLLAMNIFMSYSTAVHADDDYNLKDAVYNVLDIACIIGGLLASPETGGMSLLITAKGILDIADDAEYIYRYITDNGDGTYTINEDFIQAVLDAAQQLEDQGFTDSNVESQNNGSLYNYKWTVSNTYMYAELYKSVDSSHHDTYIRSCEVSGRIAGFNNVYSGTSSGRNYTSYNHSVFNKSIKVVTASGQGIFVTDGNVTKRSITGSLGDGITVWDGTVKGDIYSGSSSFGGNFPIFSTSDAMQNYLSTGKGYKDAINYRAQPLFRYHSAYTPTYSGGSVTVNRTVINNINSKITEVDSDDSLTDDQKIEILQQYIYSGGTSGTGGGGSGSYPGDTDYDDNKDLPAGTDLTDTNSWLKKIYLKVCQIYDKMNETVESAEQTALDGIQSKLDEISEILKKIKGWTIADTVVDAADAVADWLDFITDMFTDVDSGVSAISSTMDDAANLMKTKFPFCLPWDVAALITFLAHDPQTPVFQLPIIIENFGIEEYIEVDMTRFSVLSSLSRTLLSLIYCYGLINLTFKVIPIVKEEN